MQHLAVTSPEKFRDRNDNNQTFSSESIIWPPKVNSVWFTVVLFAVNDSDLGPEERCRHIMQTFGVYFIMSLI